MVEFILYALRLELFTEEIAHISVLVESQGAELRITDNRNDFNYLYAKSSTETTVAILCASSMKEIEDLLMMKTELGRIPIVLLLPDERTETLQTAILLNPIFFVSTHGRSMHLKFAINELLHIYNMHYYETPKKHTFVQKRSA